MAHILPEVLEIRSLYKNLRDVKHPFETAAAIERIHDCLRCGTDTQGWRQVDWRSSLGHGHSGYSSGGNHSTNKHFTHRNSSNNNSNAKSYSSNTISMNRTGNSGMANKNIICTPPRISAPQKYQSIFKSSKEESFEDRVLNTIILGKLNKFSPVNYDEIKEFLCQIFDSGELDFLKDFMKLVFQKATSEEIYCSLYAKLLSELTEKYTILLSEMVILYKEYMTIFEEINESDVANYDEFVELNNKKKYRLGYSQFLAELVKYNILDRELLIKTISTIVKQIPLAAGSVEYSKIGEEYSNCLHKIIIALSSGTSDNICSICTCISNDIKDKIQPYTIKSADNKLSMKARFALLDVFEKLNSIVPK